MPVYGSAACPGYELDTEFRGSKPLLPPPPAGRVSPAAVQAAKVHVLTEDGRDGWVAEATEQVL